MNLSGLSGSLRLRLLVGTLFWIVVSILVAGWGLGSLFRQHVADQFHAELRTHLDQLAAHMTFDDQGRIKLALPMSDPRLNRPYSGYYWQIDFVDDRGSDNSAGIGHLRSRSLWDHVLTAPLDTPADGEVHQHRVAGPEGRVLGMVERSVGVDDAPDGKLRRVRLIVAADENLMSEPVARFSGSLWLALGLLGIGLVIAAVVQVVVGLAPLRKLRIALGRVRSGETPTLEGKFPGEITPLISEFNTVLTQNAEVVDRARTHAGNLAHALKTPLTVLANAASAGDLERGELSRLVADQVDLARRQIDYHLARAQAAATMRLPGAKTPLQPIIDGLVRTMRRLHAERQLDMIVRTFPESLSFRGETQDLQEMLGNLLDNACKWAARKVELTVRSDGRMLTIAIDDDGPGLALEQRDRVMRRGIRADEQVPCSGLGLAIVDDLAQLYGGQVSLNDSPCGGLRAELTLPGSAQNNA